MKTRRTSLWVLGGVIVMAALFSVAWQQSDLGKAAGDLDRQRAAARREGVPLEWEDLRKLVPPVREADNAASLYAIGFRELHAAGNLKGVSPDRLIEALRMGTPKPVDLKKAEAGLIAAGPALSQIAAATTRPGFWIDRKWEEGPRLLFPELADARSASRALVLRAMLGIDPKASAADLRAAVRLGSDFGSEPILISALVQSSIESCVEDGIRYLARRGGPWPAAMTPVIDAMGPLPDLHRTFSGEVVMANHVADEFVKAGPNAFMTEGQVPLALRFAGFRPVRDALQSRVVEYWRKVYAALPTDPLDLTATRAATSTPIPSGASQTLLDIVTPVLSGVGDLAVKMEAQRRLSKVAIELWQGKTPVLPADPYGKGLIHLKRDAKGWTLWSVGPDGIDDGALKRTKLSDPKYDLIVTSDGR